MPIKKVNGFKIKNVKGTSKTEKAAQKRLKAIKIEQKKRGKGKRVQAQKKK